ncbi:MAG: MFS transporter [Crocinitomicaceae bacterium]|nr:MFS transporter [Crocinitomicaceae bacterium]|tara:strand:+ start:127010 stop:128278 length:1269 start_codon:yes stop_codon:yes gene_type:complete
MNEINLSKKLKYLFSLPVIVAALGYFVDIYDLTLFGIVRVESLKDLSLDVDYVGSLILNWQMFGLLLGGIIWGVFGDKKGRLSVLFGSILVYSLANIACGFLPQMQFMDTTILYCILRFIAGIGLAGELGAGITLVSESLPKDLRAIGTSLVAGFGLLGAVVAKLTVGFSGDWTVTYFIGGGLGLALLVLRVGVSESGIYNDIKTNVNIKKGSFISFFTNYSRFVRYIKCITIGLPTWFCIGIFAFFGNQFSVPLSIDGDIDPGACIMWAYIGISAGDFASGFLSHMLNSRKKAIFWMLIFTLLGVILLVSGCAKTVEMYYVFMVWLGFGTGYWAMFVTVGAEQFGTNIRSTAATTIPNMVRGSLPLMVILFNYIKEDFYSVSSDGVLTAAIIVGIIAFTLAIYSTLTIEETHNKDLDFIDE